MMKKNCLLLFLSLFILQSSQAQDTLSVLFLGNSYTASNNLPIMVADIAAAQGDHLIHDKVTPGGYTLNGHSTNTSTQGKIALGDWDFVTLQDQSQLPSFPPSQVSTEVYPYAAQLAMDIRTANACTHPIFFMTWGRENGDQSNCEFYEPLCTYEGMQGRLSASYLEMAQNNNAMVAPVGEAWRRVRETYPDIQLYSGDGSHPSVYGTYLAASVFYTMMYGKSITGNYFIPTNISAEDAEAIRSKAEETVFDVNAEWDYTVLDVEADANYEIMDDMVSFTGISSNADTYLWNFGDGNTSDVANPEYSYSASGTYTVTYTASNDCNMDSYSFEISFILSNLDDVVIENKPLLEILPNPSNGIIFFRTNMESTTQVELIDITGKKLASYNIENGSSLDLSSLPQGLYYIGFWNEEKMIYTKFIKK